jgi:hypothetical protein
VQRADRVEHLERVVRAPQLDIDDRLPTRAAERGDERPRLLDRRERVEVAVYDEGRRRVGPDAEERRRAPEHVGRLRELPLHDPAFE